MTLRALAAAAIVALLATTLVAGCDDDDGPIEPGRIPSVLGYDEEQARALLEKLGLGVHVTDGRDCPAPGEAVGTDPAQGTRFTTRLTVDLAITTEQPQGGDPFRCTDTDPGGYDLLRYARGNGPRPAFTSSVAVSTPDGPVPLAEALHDLVEQADRPRPIESAGRLAFVSPSLDYSHGRAGSFQGGPCALPIPGALKGRTDWLLTVHADALGPPTCPFAMLVFRQGDVPDGAIDAIYVHPATLATNKPQGTLRSIVGYDATQARALLQADGLHVVMRREPCVPPVDVALRTEPAQGTPLDGIGAVKLFYGASADHCPRPGTDESSAWQLLRFARRLAPAPPFADDVRVYRDGEQTRDITGDRASTDDAWECVEDDCLSPLGHLALEARQSYPTTAGARATYDSPVLVDVPVGSVAECPLAADPPFEDYETVYLADPGAGRPCPDEQILVHRTDDRIDAVALATGAGDPPEAN